MITYKYFPQINELETELGVERSRSSLSTNTLDETRAKIEQLSARISELEAVNLGLQQRMSECAQRLEDERFTHRTQVKIRTRHVTDIGRCSEQRVSMKLSF